MLPANKKKSLDALKRLSGLNKKVEDQLNEDTYCPDILQNVLAMKGHLEYIQAQVLDSHMNTCAAKKLASKDKSAFIKELLTVIGLSIR